MARTTERTRTYPRVTTLAAGPYRGCRDAIDPTTADPQLARAIENCYRGAGPGGSAQVGRPGFDEMGSAAGSVVQAGPMTWTLPSGTRQTVKVVDGELYTYNWASPAWTKVVTTANLTTNSVTLAATGRVYLTPALDGLIVNDVTNVPFYWDGASGAGGITKLTNAPAAWSGPPTVYASQVFVFASQTLYWSEPGAINTGYAAGGYNNAWDNPGGIPDPITGIKGTNEALYVFRARSSIAILGAVGPDLATAHTKANISPTIGTISPAAIYEVAQGVVIIDADANPWLVHYGAAEPLALWQDCLQTTKSLPRAVLPNAWAVEDEQTGTLLLGVAGLSHTWPSQALCFMIDDLQYNGTWFWGVDATSAGVVIDGNGLQRWAHGDLTTARTQAHGTTNDGPWSDSIAGTDTAIAKRIVGPYLGFDPVSELLVNRITAGFAGGGMSAAEISYETSRGASIPLGVSLAAGGDGFDLDVDTLGTGMIGDIVRSGQGTVGCAGGGRYVSPIIGHSTIDEPFGHDVVLVAVGNRQGNPKQP